MTAQIISIDAFRKKASSTTTTLMVVDEEVKNNKAINAITMAMQGVLASLNVHGIDLENKEIIPLLNLIKRFITASVNQGLNIPDNLTEALRFYVELAEIADSEPT